MIYKILKIERKTTSTGKPMARVELLDINGQKHTGITMWADYPNFSTLDVNHSTEGDIVTKEKDGYLNKTLYPARTNTLGTRPTRSPAAITKAMEKKAENIEKAQENRAEGVKVSATFRDATLISVEMIKQKGANFEDDLKQEWLKWRSWLWQNWDHKETDEPPFMN